MNAKCVVVVFGNECMMTRVPIHAQARIQTITDFGYLTVRIGIGVTTNPNWAKRNLEPPARMDPPIIARVKVEQSRKTAHNFCSGKVPFPGTFTRGNAADAVPRAARNMLKIAAVHPAFLCPPCSSQPMATVYTALTREEARIAHAVELCV